MRKDAHKKWLWILSIVMMVPFWLVHLQFAACRCMDGQARAYAVTMLDGIILGLLTLGRLKKHPARLLIFYFVFMTFSVVLIKYFLHHPRPLKLKLSSALLIR